MYIGIQATSELELDEGPDADTVAELDGGEPLRLIRCTIDFGAYKEFKLHPIQDVELPEPNPGEPDNTSALTLFYLTHQSDWKLREGGLLYVVGAECGNFFNCMSSYRMHGSIMIGEWDSLFATLKISGYRKNVIPCMVGLSSTTERL
jgi:hypothetical protein